MRWVGGTWWELPLLPGWSAKDDPECLSITKSEEGTLQLSAAVKSAGTVTMEELREFYGSRIPENAEFVEASMGSFRGFATSYKEDNTYWQKLWLANGSLLVFVTYNGTESSWQSEKVEVLEMLASLRLRPTQNQVPT